MKKLLVAMGMVLLGCVSAGCEPVDYSRGEVVEVRYEPAHTDIDNCGISCFDRDEIPDEWKLRLKFSDGSFGWKVVSQTEYDACQVGERFPECADLTPTESAS